MRFDQEGHELRCEWGLQGVRHLAATSDAVVVVDVLSFSTAVDIAVANGAMVLPYRWNDESAQRFAAENDALLAGARNHPVRYSLSPASLQSIPAGASLVLPSPNGSTLSLETGEVPLFTACLRNAPSLAAHLARLFRRIAVIPAGEQWSDGSLRPCLEDWLGAGAVLSELPGARSPEAELAVAGFERFRGSLKDALFQCGSGQELVLRGFAADVELASQFDVSATAPRLSNQRFLDASRPGAIF